MPTSSTSDFLAPEQPETPDVAGAYPRLTDEQLMLLRRFGEIGFDWLSLLEWLPFNFVLRRGDHQVGTYKRVLGKMRDRYVLEVNPDLADVDRRLLVAFTIGLDALQDR